MRTWVIGVAVAAVAFFALRGGPGGRADIAVISLAGGVEKHLTKFKKVIGEDYDGYRNHIYRVLTYTMHFLGGDETHLKAIEAALVYHDIALWTDGKLAYLEPSWEQAKAKLAKSMSDEELQLVHDIIVNHHKVTAFEGKHADVVNAVRRADWIDASSGVIHMGMRRANIDLVSSTIAEAGFHATLASFFPRLHGYDMFTATKEILKIFKW